MAAQQETLDKLKELTNDKMDKMSDQDLKQMLKDLRGAGLVALGGQVIDRLPRSEAERMLAESRHDAQTATMR